MSSIFNHAYFDFVDRIAAHLPEGVPIFAIIPRTPQQGDYLTTILQQVQAVLQGSTSENGKVGLAVVANTPVPHCSHPNVPGPYFDEVLFSYDVLSDEAINFSDNGFQTYVEDVAEVIIGVMHDYTPQGVSNVVVARKEAVIDITPTLQEGFRGARVNLCTSFGFSPMPKVALPQISTGNGQVSITCATAGAAIYYTLDDSLPWSGNATATQYSAPFDTPSSGTIIRAAAYNDGIQGSDTALVTI